MVGYRHCSFLNSCSINADFPDPMGPPVPMVKARSLKLVRVDSSFRILNGTF